MTVKALGIILLAILFASATAKQWFEQGHTAFLTSKNFDNAVKAPGKYKFVKFFSHHCTWCRKLKYVVDKLMKEKNWPFEFYDVDCTKHSALCKQKVNAKAFPFVGIYDIDGNLEETIRGFYPLDVIRDSFVSISSKQEQALKKFESKGNEGIIVPPKEVKQMKAATLSHKKPEVPAPIPEKVSEKEEIAPVEVLNPPTEQTQEWSSVTEGIKILIILFGIWMFYKQVNPYLERQDLENRTKIIELPINTTNTFSKVKDEESRNLMSDNL